MSDILHPTDLITAVHNGTLTVIDRPVFMGLGELRLLNLANGGCVNSAILLHAFMLGEAWLWHLGYDNLAVLTQRDDPDNVIRVISISPAHALALAVLQARYAVACAAHLRMGEVANPDAK